MSRDALELPGSFLSLILGDVIHEFVVGNDLFVLFIIHSTPEFDSDGFT